MIKMMFNKITIFICFLLYGQLLGNDLIRIKNLRIDSKANGLFISIDTSMPLSMEKLTGWINDDWFYLTVHEGIGDSAAITSTPFSFPVLDIDNTNSDESTQLAIRLSGQIENFELYLSQDKHTIIVALYYPAETVLTLMERQEEYGTHLFTLDKRLQTVLYLSGTALAISGIIYGDDSHGQNVELLLGVGILICTFIYDSLGK